jgi:hypothetical protein
MMQAGRLNTPRERKDQTGDASKIKNYDIDFQALITVSATGGHVPSGVCDLHG